MSETEIETTIRRLLLFQKSTKNKENEQHIEDIQKQLINICEKFHFFVKKIKSNKNINSDEIISDIVKHIEFIYMKEDEIIWKYGDKINEMYIIFLGEVNIYKPQQKKDIEEPQLLCTLEKGYSIGEDFLKNNLYRRTYLAKTKSYCILGKLSSKEYYRILNKVLFEENILINSFLKELKLFSSDFIERFEKFTIIKYYNKNEYIFKQHDEFNTFYFILSGTVRLMLNLNRLVKSKIDHNILIGKNIKRFTTSRLFEIKGFYKESINYNLVDLTYGDIIGGIEYYNHYNNYKYDVKCLNNVEVLKIDLNHFNEILINEEMEIFNKKVENQAAIILNRIKEIKEGRQMIKIKDYIFSKNKFTKAFLLNNPLSKKSETKTELYINSGSNPFKIKQNYSKKKLINTKLFLNSIEEYKNGKLSKSNKNKTKIKDFFTNIDYYKKQTPVGSIFPSFSSLENIPTNNHKKIFLINKSDSNSIENSNKRNNKMQKNRTISSSLSLEYKLNIKNKENILNCKKSSKKNYQKKLMNRNEMKNKIIFNNENIKEKLFQYFNKNSTKSNNFYYNINTFKNTQFKTINSE